MCSNLKKIAKTNNFVIVSTGLSLCFFLLYTSLNLSEEYDDNEND